VNETPSEQKTEGMSKAPHPGRRDETLDRWDALVTGALVLAGLLILLWTLADYGLCWDEPTYLDQALEYLNYFQSRGPDSPFSWSDLPQLFETRDRHPPLHRLITLPILWLFGSAPQLLAARGATVLTSSLLLGAVYLWGRRRLGRPAAAGSALMLLLYPRFFAHSHLFQLDAAITFWWALVLWLFYEGRNRWDLWALACAAFTGALLTKFTAILLPTALLSWVIVCRYGFRGRHALPYDTVLDWILKLYLMAMVGLALFFTLWPMFWSDFRYHVLNYITFQMKHFNPGVYYLGRQYGGDAIPGWHYPWVMLLVTLTPAHLALLAVGLWTWMRRWKDEWYVLTLVSAFFPLLVFSAPTIPKYDGVRLFLIALPGLALLMGIGLQRLIDRLAAWKGRSLSDRRGKTAAWALVALACLLAATSLVHIHPFQLSYYNLFVGGLKGAERMGFQLTYFGEVMDAFYPELNSLLEEGDTLFVVATYRNLDYPHTVTDQPGDAHHLRPGVQLQALSKEHIEEATGARRFLLVVRRGKLMPDDVAHFQERLTPVHDFVIRGVTMARLHRLVE